MRAPILRSPSVPQRVKIALHDPLASSFVVTSNHLVSFAHGCAGFKIHAPQNGVFAVALLDPDNGFEQRLLTRLKGVVGKEIDRCVNLADKITKGDVDAADGNIGERGARVKGVGCLAEPFE